MQNIKEQLEQALKSATTAEQVEQIRIDFLGRKGSITLLAKNADMLKEATIETAKESERGVVDIETLQHTNQELINTLEEVRQIQEDGRKRRAEAEAELGRLEGELKQKLLEIRG